MNVSTPEPMPEPGRQDVSDSLKSRFNDFIDERTSLGVEKYGTPLQTHNGRDVQTDMIQELLDFTQYQEQSRMELIDALEDARAQIRLLTGENITP